MKAKHPKDGNHGKRGMVSGNGRYCRAKLERFLAGRLRGSSCPKKIATMGRN